MAAWMTVVLNSNLDANAAGPVWGTFRTELDVGGIWEGTWQGLRVTEDGLWSATLHVVGKGYGGQVDGMKMMADEQVLSPFPIPLVYSGTVHGRIVDPH